MTFDKINEHLWAVCWDGEDDNEFYRLFDLWSDVSYLYEFFTRHSDTINRYFHTNIANAVADTIEDAEFLEKQLFKLNSNDNPAPLFQPLGGADRKVYTLQRNKAKIVGRKQHDSWLRIYALKLDEGVFLITGGAIKMSRKMQDDPETNEELNKINKCRAYLESENVIDTQGLSDLIEE